MPLDSRGWKESEDVLEGWTIPTRRTEEEKRIYGPRAENLPKQLELLKELKEKLEKKPDVLMQLRADLAEREAAYPNESRFKHRLELLRHYLLHNKKLRMKGKFQKVYFIDLYEIFKGRKIVDNIFGDDLLQKTIEDAERGTGYLEMEKPESRESPKKESKEREKMLHSLEKLRDENKELFTRKRWEWDSLNDVTLKHFLESVKHVVKREREKAMKTSTTKKASPPKKASTTKKASPPKKASTTKKASPPKKASTTQKAKRKRCPNGTRRNKKTGECEPKK